MQRPASMQQVIQRVSAALAHRPRLAALFANCYPNTYETTLRTLLDGTSFVITGDIPAMWLRDSSAQVRHYLPAAREDTALAEMIAGLCRRQSRLIRLDPYANAFNQEPNGACFREDMLEELSLAAGKAGKRIKVHIAVDTAMARIGIRPDDSGLSFVKKALETEEIEVEGIFTHFSKADETAPENTFRQIREFTEFCGRIEKELGYRIPVQHCSNSAGLIRFPEANLDMVRAGITLYGLWPSEEVPKDVVPLRPLLSLHSHVVYVKTVPAGTAVSYGGTFVTEKETRIATIPVGYGDGYARGLSNKGEVLIRGKRVPILGRVCMDQFMVDVTGLPDVREGDPVTLIGTDGTETITLEELGRISGRFNYEFACDLGKRVPRIYSEKRR